MTHAFPDYYQFAHPTRVVAGRGMIEGVGFEFMKEGAKRPLIVTDQVIRETGLAGKAEATLLVPQTSDELMPVLTAIPLQLLAYQVAVLKGTDVDQPRHRRVVVVDESPRLDGDVGALGDPAR